MFVLKQIRRKGGEKTKPKKNVPFGNLNFLAKMKFRESGVSKKLIF